MAVRLYIVWLAAHCLPFADLEAIMDPKTTVFPMIPQRFTERGIVDADGVEHEIDMVIAATGYDQSHMPRFMKTINGKSVTEFWKDPHSPPSYMALCLRGMPNYFNSSSAYGPLTQGNYYQSSEAFTQYIVKAIDKMQMDRIVSIMPKDKAVDHFVRHANAYLKRTAVTGTCVSWYKGNDYANAPALWPGARGQFLRILETPRFEDFDIVYEDPEDTFAYFGNGWTLQDDAPDDADKTWYMGKPQKAVDPSVIDQLRGTAPSVKKIVQGMAAMPTKNQ